MEHLIFIAIAMVGAVVVAVVQDRWRESRGPARAQAATEGADLSLAGRISADLGTLLKVTVQREGDAIVARGRGRWRGRAWALPLAPGAVARRSVEDDDDLSLWVLEEYRDDTGRRWSVGVRETDRAALAGLRSQAQGSVTPRRALPTWAWGTALALLLAAAFCWAAYLTSYRATGTVVDRIDDFTCDVRWTSPAGEVYTTSMNCDSDAATGATQPIIAQTGILEGEAGRVDALVDLLLWGPLIGVALVLVAGLVTSRGQGGRRGPPVPLSPILVDNKHATTSTSATSVASTAPSPSASVDGAPELENSLTRLAEVAARQCGWDLDGERPPAERTLGERGGEVLSALLSVGWWFTFAGAVALTLGFWDSIPAQVRPLLPWILAGVLLLQLVRTAGLWRALTAPWSQPFTSDWDLVGAPLGETPGALLSQGGRAFWFVPLRHRPPRTGRAQVRGDLSDGGVIQLRIADRIYTTVGPVERIDTEVETDLRRALRHELVEASD